MSTNPDEPPGQPVHEPGLGRLSAPVPGGLGSLAQTARDKHVKTARQILIIVGVLMVLSQAVMYVIEFGQVSDQIQKEARDLGPDRHVMTDQIRAAEQAAQRALLAVHAVAIGVGVAFVFLGVLVTKSPVAVSSVALALFLAREVAFALIDPANLARGLIIKVVVIVALVKAMQAALASRSDVATAQPGDAAA